MELKRPSLICHHTWASFRSNASAFQHLYVESQRRISAQCPCHHLSSCSGPTAMSTHADCYDRMKRYVGVKPSTTTVETGSRPPPQNLFAESTLQESAPLSYAQSIGQLVDRKSLSFHMCAFVRHGLQSESFLYSASFQRRNTIRQREVQVFFGKSHSPMLVGEDTMKEKEHHCSLSTMVLSTLNSSSEEVVLMQWIDCSDRRAL